MTDLEKRAIKALQSVVMPSEGWYAARAEYLHGRMLIMPNARLISTQAGDLWYLVWRFRRQITDRELVDTANELVNKVRSLPFPVGESEGVNA